MKGISYRLQLLPLQRAEPEQRTVSRASWAWPRPAAAALAATAAAAPRVLPHTEVDDVSRDVHQDNAGHVYIKYTCWHTYTIHLLGAFDISFDLICVKTLGIKLPKL